MAAIMTGTQPEQCLAKADIAGLKTIQDQLGRLRDLAVLEHRGRQAYETREIKRHTRTGDCLARATSSCHTHGGRGPDPTFSTRW
jgi:hypothetical protein